MPKDRSEAEWCAAADRSVVLDGDIALRTLAVLETFEELLAETDLSPEQVRVLAAGRGEDWGALRVVLPACRAALAAHFDDGDGGDGSAGDREPRVPRPSAPAAAAPAPNPQG